jgi:hypothetical protein
LRDGTGLYACALPRIKSGVRRDAPNPRILHGRKAVSAHTRNDPIARS